MYVSLSVNLLFATLCYSLNSSHPLLPPLCHKCVLCIWVFIVVVLLSPVPTLCNSINCSTPGFPVFPYLPEFPQTHVHWINDAIQPSHPLSLPSFAISLSQHQSLSSLSAFHIRWPKIGASASAPVLRMNIKDWFPLGLTILISLLSKGLSWVLSSTTIWKHQFFPCSAFLVVQFSHPYMTTGKTIALTVWTFVSKVGVSAF